MTDNDISFGGKYIIRTTSLLAGKTVYCIGKVVKIVTVPHDDEDDFDGFPPPQGATNLADIKTYAVQVSNGTIPTVIQNLTAVDNFIKAITDDILNEIVL